VIDRDRRTIAEIGPLLERRAVSSTRLVEQCLTRIEARRDLNAFITVMAERALEQAAQADGEIGAGCYRGPLHGVPVSVKDLVHVAGVPTTSGSAVPALHPAADAPVVQRLRAAGAVIVGKTNLHEFAFGTTGEDTAFGQIRNPFDTTRSAGGSSSGAAVALVEGMSFASIGTDTGGSVRIPAAACGTVGLKPTHGEVPVEGVVPLSRTCDHVGPLTRTVGDARILFEILAAAPIPAMPVRTLRLGVPRGHLLARLDAEVRDMLANVRSQLARDGWTVEDVEIDHSEITPDVYLHIVLAEASEYHAATLDTDASGYSPAVRLRLELGRYVLAEDYVRALRLREMLAASVDRALSTCDALLLPALSIPAPPLGASTVDIDGTPEPVRAAMLRLTQLFNLTGHPAVAVPAGRTRAGLPLGIQLVGARHRTGRLLDVAEAVEARLAADVA